MDSSSLVLGGSSYMRSMAALNPAQALSGVRQHLQITGLPSTTAREDKPISRLTLSYIHPSAANHIPEAIGRFTKEVNIHIHRDDPPPPMPGATQPQGRSGK